MSCSDKYTPIHYMISNKNLSCNKVALHLSSVGQYQSRKQLFVRNHNAQLKKA